MLCVEGISTVSGPYDYPSDHWCTKVLYLSNGSKVAVCKEAAFPYKTILFIDDVEIGGPANFLDVEAAINYADGLCLS